MLLVLRINIDDMFRVPLVSSAWRAENGRWHCCQGTWRSREKRWWTQLLNIHQPCLAPKNYCKHMQTWYIMRSLIPCAPNIHPAMMIVIPLYYIDIGQGNIVDLNSMKVTGKLANLWFEIKSPNSISKTWYNESWPFNIDWFGCH